MNAELFADWDSLAFAFEDEQDFAIRDVTDRTWIVIGDEDGYYWATSFRYEEEERAVWRFESAPVAFPVTFLAPRGVSA